MARLKRILRHPAAAVVLLVLLIASVWSLPKGWYGGSVVGKWIGEWYLARPTGPYRPSLEVYLIREDDRFVIHDPNTESFDAISKAMNDAEVEVLMGVAGEQHFVEGFYALARERTRRYAYAHPLRNPTTLRAAELDLARQTFVDWIAETEGGSWRWLADRVHDRNEEIVSVRWVGVAHNAATLALLAALLYSLRWNLSSTVWRARNRAKRLSRGECPRCRYSIQGLAVKKCPECGEEWS